jgi:hypothetical protein
MFKAIYPLDWENIMKYSLANDSSISLVHLLG